GGMRQSGILAAAALWALDNNLERLGEDHENARCLAERLAASTAVRARAPDSNMVLLEIRSATDSAHAVPALAAAGVLVVPLGPKRLRAVTHLDVSRDDCLKAADIIETVLG